MIKNKIALKLTLFFAIALLIFSLAVGGIFVILFKNYTTKMHKEDLTEKATRIAETLSAYNLETAQSNNTPSQESSGMQKGKNNASNTMNGQGKNGMAGYSLFLNLVKDSSLSDIWVIDENHEVLSGKGMNEGYTTKTLPNDATKVISEVFSGKISVSESFSSVLETPTLTVGAPMTDSTGKITGAVLLHSPIHGLDEATAKGVTLLLISILLALLLAFLISIRFSYLLTKPLNTIRKTTLKLAEGDYAAKTGMKNKDEIGQLGQTIDYLSDELQLAKDQSSKLEQLRQDFIANISHELKTPVTVIKGSLSAITEKVVTDPNQIENYHEQMLRETVFLEVLIRDLLDLSKLQSLEFHIEKEAVALSEILREVINSGKSIATQKNMEIVLKKENPLSLFQGDYGRLRQMFMIIMDNAIKFSPKNSHIHVSFKENLVTIRDEGPGIPENDQPYIFDKFYQSKSEDNKLGSGLGLAISKAIALRHGIEISVANHPQGGAEFTFYFNPENPK